ncbi:MAG: hypothetical protein ACI30J_08895 [Paludibacteraceae bacterium]
MKQIKVIHKFRDKYNYSHIYCVGEVVSFDDERANDIVERGLGSMVSAPKETKKNEQSSHSTTVLTEEVNPSDGDGVNSSETEDDKESASHVVVPSTETKAEDTAEVHEPATPKETKKPKSNGSRKGGKNVE